MHFPTPFLALSLSLSGVLAQTLHLAGDSTTANWPDTSVRQGWGSYFSKYTTLTINNKAVSGRSARSYTREGRFDTLATQVEKGDFVVLEFGHNDGGSLTPIDNGRSACGIVGGSCQTVYNGVAETVYTFDAYLYNATRLLESKGAVVIISSQTPNNVWETGSFVYSPNRFVGLAQQAAESAGVVFVYHGKFVAEAYKSAGGPAVNGWYPEDHTHTNIDGAKVVARAFAEAVLASVSELKGFIKGV